MKIFWHFILNYYVKCTKVPFSALERLMNDNMDINDIIFRHDFEDDFDITNSLKEQVNEHMIEERYEDGRKPSNKKPKKKNNVLKILSIITAVAVLFLVFLVFTKPGRKLVYNAASNYVFSQLDYDEDESFFNEAGEFLPSSDAGREEDYITNYLIFGIEEIGGARNTDSMIIASINSKEKVISITSLMRDSYVDIPGYKKTKLNAAYGKGGIKLLIDTIEENFFIHIDGYASVNFSAFESLIDKLGGVDIEISQKEADYLNTTNYISVKSNRTLKAGINHMNGNQALGYCRVRKVATIEGVNNDHGRTLRQRKVLTALFDKFKDQSLRSMMDTVNSCLSYVKTNATQKQISSAIESVVENKITNITSLRIPFDGMYEAPKKYEGVTYPLVLDMDANIIEFFKEVYGDTEEEAKQMLDIARQKLNEKKQ